MKPTAYSYIRFSQISQAKGGSLERQSMSAQEYAEKEGLVLDTTLVFRDLGVSAFKGKNSRDGALNEFMVAVESGKVQAGSYLLIENMDRLTRLPVMDAFGVFQRILAGGIVLVTLKNGNKYSKASLDQDWTQLMPVLFDMSRGYGESERKSELLGKAWRKKKQEAASELKPLGNNAPMWLTLEWDEDLNKQVYRPIPERAEIIRRIFQLSIDGYGHGSIAILLNKDKVPAFRGGSWGTTTISRTLGNRAVMGEYQPKAGTGKNRVESGPPVPGFFPVVVEPSLFARAQDAINSRYINRTTKQSFTFNVWQGIALCRECGASMRLVDKGKPPKGHTYLTCANSQKGMCDAKSLRLDASEKVFQELLAMTGNTSLVADDTAKMENELRAARGSLLAEQSKYDSLTEALADSPSKAGAGLLAKQEDRIAEVKEAIAKLEAALAASSVVDRKTFFDKLDLTSREIRNQANALLKRLEIKVTMFSGGRKFKGASYYAVYQKERLIMKLYDDSGKIDVQPYSTDVSMRLYHQGELRGDELYVNVGFGSKQLPKPKTFGEGRDDSEG